MQEIVQRVVPDLLTRGTVFLLLESIQCDLLWINVLEVLDYDGLVMQFRCVI